MGKIETAYLSASYQVNGRAENSALNLLKLFACINVVFVHVVFPGRFGEIMVVVGNYAVQVFIMIAGYYSYDRDAAVISRRLRKILRILVYGLILFTAYAILNAVLRHEAAAWFRSQLTWKTPIKLVLFCTIDFAIPLWYLVAMSETYAIWLLVVKKGWQNAAMKLIPFLLAAYVALRTVCETMELPWFWKINCFASAMPWFLIGYYLHSAKGKELFRFRLEQYIFAALLGLTIMIIPVAFDLPVNFKSAGVIPFSVSLFMLAVKYSDIKVSRALVYMGDQLSLNIYILHVLINKCMMKALNAAGFPWVNKAAFLWLRPLIVLGLSIAASYMIDQLKRHSVALRRILP